MFSEIFTKLQELGIAADENSNAMIACWDKHLVCRYANRAYYDWFGIPPENMVNKITLPELLGPLYEKNRPYITGALDGKVQVFKRNVVSPAGKNRHSIATYCPQFAGKEVIGFFVHVEDDDHYLTLNKTTQKKAVNLLHDPVQDAVDTLKACLLSGFPGVNYLAKIHYLSASRLKREFKSRYNKGVLEFYRHLQMKLAEDYIKQKRCSKKQVAAIFNFSNPFNFSNCYKKYLADKADKLRDEEISQITDDRYKTFIAQAPFAIAMFDNDLIYQAASKRYIDDYHLRNKQLTGKGLYELFPHLEPKWKKIHKTALKGKTAHGEDTFELENGSYVWLRWDVKPWMTHDDKIGGIIIFTEDITAIKHKDDENKKILEILNKATEIVRIGAWKKNFKTNTGYLSDVTRDILELPAHYQTTDKLDLDFYKQGHSRNLMAKVLKEAIEQGKAFDIKVEIITAKGNKKRVRVAGYPEFRMGKCERLFGIYQEIKSPSGKRG